MFRLLSDEDFSGPLVRALRQRVPDLDLVRVQDVELMGVPDAGVLDFAASDTRIVLTHDVNTMTAAAIARVQAGEPMPGLFVIPQSLPLGRALQELELRVLATEMDEWLNRIEYLS